MNRSHILDSSTLYCILPSPPYSLFNLETETSQKCYKGTPCHYIDENLREVVIIWYQLENVRFCSVRKPLLRREWLPHLPPEPRRHGVLGLEVVGEPLPEDPPAAQLPESRLRPEGQHQQHRESSYNTTKTGCNIFGGYMSFLYAHWRTFRCRKSSFCGDSSTKRCEFLNNEVFIWIIFS